jgi:hypothetical protein
VRARGVLSDGHLGEVDVERREGTSCAGRSSGSPSSDPMRNVASGR